jgi:hypothetical protein
MSIDVKEYFNLIGKKTTKNNQIIIDFITSYSTQNGIPFGNDVFFNLMIGNMPLTYIGNVCINIHSFLVNKNKNVDIIVEYIYSFDNDFSLMMKYLMSGKEDILLGISIYQLINFIGVIKCKDKILRYLIENTKENRAKKIEMLIGNNAN